MNESQSCIFVPSNRGYRNGRNTAFKATSPSPTVRTISTDAGIQEQMSLPSLPSAYLLGLGSATSDAKLVQAQTSVTQKAPLLDDEALTSYFRNFHESHPILIRPKLRKPELWHAALQAAVQLIGSRYLDYVIQKEAYQSILEATLSQNSHDNVEFIQALLLGSIAQHSLANTQSAIDHLARAVDLGLELGLNMEDKVKLLAAGDALLTESYRRTWWELYAIDAMLAALHQKPTFRTNQVTITTRLPCEERAFANGDQNISLGPSLQQLREKAFVNSNPAISSFAYRIDACQMLARVLANSAEPDVYRSEDIAQGIDALLSSWHHDLPADKQELSVTGGPMDECMFQARMIVSSSLIYLHLPKSSLSRTRLPSSITHTKCAHRVTQSAAAGSYHLHAIKAMAAAKELSILASSLGDIKRHTPFFICSLVLAAVVNISACSAQACPCLDPHRDRVLQAVGLLRSFSHVWPIAVEVMQQVRSTAAEVLSVGLGGQRSDANEPPDATAWLMEDFPWDDVAEVDMSDMSSSPLENIF